MHGSGLRALAAAAALWIAAVPAHALELELVPAWEGNYRPGSATEVLVRVTSAVGGTVNVTATEPHLRTVAAALVEPNAPAELAFAIRPGATEITIEARLGYGEPVVKNVQLVPLERPMLAVVVDRGVNVGDWLGAAGRYVPVPVGPRALPRTAAGYAAIAGLVLGPDTLAQLDAAQARALLAHVAGCGRVLLSVDAEHAAHTLAAHSACGARFVTQATSAAEGKSLLGAHARALPADSELLALDSQPPSILRLAVVFLGTYVALLAALTATLLMARDKVGWPLLLATPVLAALLMAAAWSKNPPERRVLLWAEQEHDAEVARFRLLYDVHGRGGGAINMTTAVELRAAENLSERGATLTLAADGTRLALEPRVLSRHTFGFSGAFASVPELAIGRDGDGPFVTYRGTGSSPTAVLAVGGRYFAVPALAPGAAWRPAAESAALPRAAVPAPLARQGDALLVALRADRLPLPAPPHDSAVAWLLLRAPTAGGAQ